MKNLVQLVYLSLSPHDLSEGSLKELLVEIRELNKRQGITGILLYHDRAFIQLIEGDADTIQGVFARIKEDKRHHTVLVLLEQLIEDRSFPDWSMAFRKISEDQTKSLEGFSDFMDENSKNEFLKNCTNEVVYLLNNFKPVKPIKFPEK